MKKHTGSILLLAALAVLSSCGNTGYKKTKGGILYKIVTSGKEPLVKEGNVIKFNYQVKIGSTDSVLNTSYGKMPGFAPITAPNPMAGDNYNPTEIFPMLHNGDSAVVVQLVDSIIKKNPMQQLPPYIKKGDKILITFKVLHVYANDSAAAPDRQAEMAKDRVRQEADQVKEIAKRKKEAEEDLKTQVPELEKWLADKKIPAQKAGRGTFVEIKDTGTGLQADSGMYATVRYTGKTLADGKVFQSNMEATAQPFTFVVGTGGAIAGWDDALKLFKKGGKGTLYIPGALAYGKNPPPGSPFKPNESLVFDIVVEDVSATPPQQQQPGQAPPPPPPAKK